MWLLRAGCGVSLEGMGEWARREGRVKVTWQTSLVPFHAGWRVWERDIGGMGNERRWGTEAPKPSVVDRDIGICRGSRDSGNKRVWIKRMVKNSRGRINASISDDRIRGR